MGDTVSGHVHVKVKPHKRSPGSAILVQFDGKLSAAKAETFSAELKKLAKKYGLGVVTASYSG
jgi:hypothetical protein